MLTNAAAATGGRTTSRGTFVASPMARDLGGRTCTQSPVIIMEEEFIGSGSQSAAWEAGRTRLVAEGDHASCLPLLVVPGLTPRSSTSSQSCLSVPGIADVNGYITLLILTVGLVDYWLGHRTCDQKMQALSNAIP